MKNNIIRTSIISIFTSVVVGICCIFGTYEAVKPKVINNNEDLRKFYEGSESSINEITGEVLKCRDIVVAAPETTGEFLNGIGFNYDTIMGSEFFNEDSVQWIEKDLFYKTPYEYSHWALGYTENQIPIVFKYSTDTYIETNQNRKASCSDLFHDFYGDDKFFRLSGEVYKTKINIKYIGQTYTGNLDISEIKEATESEIIKNSKLDNYLAEGREIPCVLIYCNLIYN